MRFAYIDSQGNEVDIPSVDALALRVELGAIKEDTELYDAQENRWGPAHTHEIFHTLSRDAEEEGFVAPPPPAAPVAPPPAFDESPEEADAEEPVLDDAPELVEPVADEVGEEASLFDFGAGLELESDEAADPSDATASGDATGGDDLDPALAGDAEEGGFGLGDFSGGFDLESPEPEEPETAASVPDADDAMDFGGGMGLETESPMDFGGGEMETESPMDFGGGEMETESPMDFGGDGGLGLEQPMSDYSPESPPNWPIRSIVSWMSPWVTSRGSRMMLSFRNRASGSRPKSRITSSSSSIFGHCLRGSWIRVGSLSIRTASSASKLLSNYVINPGDSALVCRRYSLPGLRRRIQPFGRPGKQH